MWDVYSHIFFPLLSTECSLTSWLRDVLLIFFLPDQLLMLISNFLPETVQRVFVNGQMSKISESNTEAPQGCLLSPFLFIICNDSCGASQQNTSFLMTLPSYRYFKAQSLTTALHCRRLFSGVTILVLTSVFRKHNGYDRWFQTHDWSQR